MSIPRTTAVLTLLACLASQAATQAQVQFLINDRTNDAIYRVIDLDGNGVIDEPGEVFLWFSAANSAGTIGPMNPTCLNVGAGGLALMGDQLNRNVYFLGDRNYDGDAQDALDSIVAADVTNLSGVSFAFPTGAAVDSLGRAYVVNAGNANGNDGIYRLVDLNADRDCQDAGEVTDYVTTGAFGPGNGPYSPQEIAFDADDAGYLRNSSSGLHGVYRFADANMNGRADDAGEFSVFWDAANASGITPTAGTALELDAARPRAIYTLQLLTGGIDQLLRLTDANSDGDAQDAGEAVVVWETSEANFTAIDVVSLANGDVLVTDNSTKRVIRLHDADADNLFMSAGERSDFFANSLAIVGDVRQMSVLPVRLPCSGDVNGDGIVGVSDIPPFTQTLINPLGATPAERSAADVNCDLTTNGVDIQALEDRL
ncbi:MAG: dockerin type I domain-containing protein [Phycisphaerae bacterium]|nr:dockerin type I domain-containing protein [Phycisphaerae bacterium]